MHDSVQEVITLLLRYQRAADPITAFFRQQKHNNNILPKFQQQIEMILSSYGKFEPIVYDTQGILDDGSDIVLRQRAEKSTEFELISFQIKSFDDLRKKTYMQELKAQHDDTFRKVVGLKYYFIVLCTDVKEDKDKIRNIEAEFRSADKTEIIEPAYAYTFLQHTQKRIDAFVKRTLESEDIVFKKANDALKGLDPTVKALAIFVSTELAVKGNNTLSLNAIQSNTMLNQVYDTLREQQEQELKRLRKRKSFRTLREEQHIAPFEQQLAEDMEILEDNFIELNTTSNDSIVVKNILPLTAMITDALVRYDYNADEVLEYMFNLTGVVD